MSFSTTHVPSLFLGLSRRVPLVFCSSGLSPFSVLCEMENRCGLRERWVCSTQLTVRHHSI